MTCLDSAKGVFFNTSAGSVGIRHFEKTSYCVMHIGLLWYISGGTALLGGVVQ